MARKQQTEQWAEHRRQRDEEERRQRVMVITEFDAGDPEATMHALAGEILKYCRAVRLLAIGWADAGAPFALISPGPHWRPRRSIVRALMARRPRWRGTAQDLLDAVGPAAGINSTQVISDCLRRLAPALRTVGLNVVYEQRKKDQRPFRIERVTPVTTPM
jgi:hypothetical protein